MQCDSLQGMHSLRVALLPVSDGLLHGIMCIDVYHARI